MNAAFNDTIANGEKFHLNWDKNLHSVDKNLGVFRLSYLDEGIIAYKLAYDLTGKITITSAVQLPGTDELDRHNRRQNRKMDARRSERHLIRLLAADSRRRA